MIKARRIRHATFATPDMARQLDYYQYVVGLGVVAREQNRVFLATDAEQLSLVLEQGDAPLCKRIAFEVAPDVELKELVPLLSAKGIKAAIRSDVSPGVAQALAFVDSEGTEIELIAGWMPTPATEPIRGLAVGKLGHTAFFSGDPGATANFYADVLGFKVSDWIEENFVFMRCGFEHHTVNFARSDARRLHHVAFELRDAAHMHQACDLLGRNKIPLLWGPVRHGPGHNVAVYHRNPDGHLVEFFYDLDRMVDEELGYFDPRPWHRDRPQRPKVWVGLPRDVWGLPPAPEAAEFARKPRS
jgi:catechol 2,3-dioxygenase-like lactoylglutathione lyase family enzyme